MAEHGLADTPGSACLGCPFQPDLERVKLRDEDPAGWADAVAFDAAIRHGSARANADGHPLPGQFFLHRQRVPLDQAVLRPRAGDQPETPGCGPWSCPHPAEPAPEDTPDPATAGSGDVVGLREVA